MNILRLIFGEAPESVILNEQIKMKEAQVWRCKNIKIGHDWTMEEVIDLELT